MANLKLSSPWEITYKKINAMFEYDPEVSVIFDRDVNIVKVYVDNADKAYALNELLKKQYDYGSVKLEVIVVHSNNDNVTANNYKRRILYEEALYRNPIFEYAVDGPAVFTNPITYVVFHPQVIQYFTDDLGDINGYHSTLAQDIAKDIFEESEGVFYCTDTTIVDLPKVSNVNRQSYIRHREGYTKYF